MEYHHQNEKGGTDHLGSLPKVWNRMGGFDQLEGQTAELKKWGRLPVVTARVTIGLNEMSDGHTVTIGTDKVTITCLKRAMTDKEIRERKVDDARPRVTSYYSILPAD